MKIYVMRWWCYEKKINGINLQLNSLLERVIMTVLKRTFWETGSWKPFYEIHNLVLRWRRLSHEWINKNKGKKSLLLVLTNLSYICVWNSLHLVSPQTFNFSLLNKSNQTKVEVRWQCSKRKEGRSTWVLRVSFCIF